MRSEAIVTPRVATPSGAVELLEASSAAEVVKVLTAAEVPIIRLGALFFLSTPEISPIVFLPQ